jgi:hypothetical protein
MDVLEVKCFPGQDQLEESNIYAVLAACHSLLKPTWLNCTSEAWPSMEMIRIAISAGMMLLAR